MIPIYYIDVYKNSIIIFPFSNTSYQIYFFIYILKKKRKENGTLSPSTFILSCQVVDKEYVVVGTLSFLPFTVEEREHTLLTLKLIASTAKLCNRQGTNLLNLLKFED